MIIREITSTVSGVCTPFLGDEDQARSSRQFGGSAMPAAWRTCQTRPETGVRMVTRMSFFSMLAFCSRSRSRTRSSHSTETSWGPQRSASTICSTSDKSVNRSRRRSNRRSSISSFTQRGVRSPSPLGSSSSPSPSRSQSRPNKSGPPMRMQARLPASTLFGTVARSECRTNKAISRSKDDPRGRERESRISVHACPRGRTSKGSSARQAQNQAESGIRPKYFATAFSGSRKPDSSNPHLQRLGRTDRPQIHGLPLNLGLGSRRGR